MGLQAIRAGLGHSDARKKISDEWPYYVSGLVYRYMGVPMPECALCSSLMS